MLIRSNQKNLIILYEDNHLIIVNKRAGDIVQGDKTGDTPLSEIVKNDWGNEFFLHDPSGILWHIGKFH